MKKPDIFEYNNYFDYFNEVYVLSKQANPNFSYQLFADKLKLSKTLVYDMLKTKKKLSIKNIFNFVETLELNELETEYLVFMFLEEQAKNKGSEYFKNMRKVNFNSSVGSKMSKESCLGDPETYLIVNILRETKKLISAKDMSETLQHICPMSEEKVQRTYDFLIEEDLMTVEGNSVSFSKQSFFNFNDLENFQRFSSHFDSCSQNFIGFARELGEEKRTKLPPHAFDHYYVNLPLDKAQQLDKELLFLRNKYCKEEVKSKEEDEKIVYQFDIRLFPCFESK